MWGRGRVHLPADLRAARSLRGSLNPLLDSAFRAAVSRSAAGAADAIDAELVSLVAVGSATTGEFRPDRSDVDLVAVFRQELSIEEIRLFRGAALGDLAGSPCPIGLRVRCIGELADFAAHMASWGYDVGRHAKVLYGSSVVNFLSSPQVPSELLLRNLLGQLWWVVSQPDRGTAGVVYAAARALTELCHFALVLTGAFRGTGEERLAALREGAGPAWLLKELDVFEQAFALRTGRESAGDPMHLRKAWERLFASVFCAVLPTEDGFETLGRWFPLGSPSLEEPSRKILKRAFALTLGTEEIPLSTAGVPVYPGLAVLLCLHYLWELRRRGAMDRPLLEIAGEALGFLEPVPAHASFEALLQAFARLQIRSCSAAARDLEPHLRHLLAAA
jgi:hypothetical protein